MARPLPRLSIRYERHIDIHFGFTTLACALVTLNQCWRFYQAFLAAYAAAILRTEASKPVVGAQPNARRV